MTPNGTGNMLEGPVLWDISGHGDFGEATGSTINLSWAQLVEFGITGPGTYQIAARATNADGLTATAFATLTVDVGTPVLTVNVPTTAKAGDPATIAFSVAEPGNEVVKSWTVNWGDNSAPTVLGAGATGAVHTYATPGTYGVLVTLTDSLGSHVAPKQSVQVSVDPATVSAGGPYTVAQGAALVLAPIYPPGATVTWLINGQAVTPDSNNTVSWAQLQAVKVSDPHSYSVSLQLTYGDGEKPVASTSLAVTEVAPTVTVTPPASVVQGNGATLTFNISSPSATAQAASYQVAYSVDGGPTNTITVNAPSGSGTRTLAASMIADHGTHLITGTVTDKNGGSTAFSTQVVVTQAPEVLTVSPSASSVVEGSPVTLNLSATHPAPESVLYWVVDWADGTVQRVNGTDVQATHVYGTTTTPGMPYKPTITAYDADGATVVTTPVTVAVTAALPTLALNPVSAVTVGQPTHVTGTVGDPGAGDTFTVTIDWGDGSAKSVISDLTVPTPLFDASHVYAMYGTFNVSATVLDRNDNSLTKTESVLVNGAPLAVASAAFDRSSIPEGGFVVVKTDQNGNVTSTTTLPAVLSGTLTPTRATDTSAVTIDWGDGTPDTAATVDQTTHTYTASHIYADNPAGQPNGSYTATVTAVDTTAGVTNPATATATATIQVTNAPPVVTSLAPALGTINEGDTASVSGTFTDPGIDDTHTAVISWGDGTSTLATVDDTHGTFTASHVYGANLAYVNGVPGAYQVTATVQDKDGASVSKTTAEVVDDVAPVLDNLALSAAPAEYNPVTLTGHVTDPGTQETQTLTVAWGDGVSDQVAVDPVTHLFTAVHTYTDAAAAGQASVPHTIMLTDSDGTDTATASLPITLSAAQLAVTALAASPSLEGGSTTLSGSFADSVPGTTHTVTVDWGDGTAVTAATVVDANGTFTATHSYANNPGTGTQGAYTVTASVNNDVGVSASAKTQALVTDVAPTVVNLTPNPGAVTEGGSVSLTGQVVDPGLADVEAVAVTWGDGTTSAAVVDQSTRLFTATHSYVDNPAGEPSGAYTVGVTASDDSGLTGTGTTSVTVTNAAPAVTNLVASPSGAPIGTVVQLTGTIVDPGVLDTESVSVAWGDGSTTAATVDQAARTFSATKTYAVAGPYAITATATDKDGGQGSATANLVVAGLVPTLTGVAFNSASVPEGSPVGLSGVLANAPAGSTLTVAWGDGSPASAVTPDPVTGVFGISHIYANNPPGQPAGSYTATVTATEGGTTLASATASVQVTNVPPVITGFAPVAAVVNEGSTAAVAGTFTDAGLLDTHTVTINWGDGQSTTGTVDDAHDTFGGSHVYADNGVYAVTATLSDNDGGSTAAATSETVRNVAPSIVGLVANPSSTSVGTPVVLTGTVVDPGLLDTETVQVTWGDGTTSAATVDQASRTFSASHSYATASPYTVTATATDKDGGQGSAATSVTVTGAPAPVLSGLAFTAPTANEGDSVNLDGTLTNAVAGDTLTVAWGDGSTSNYVLAAAGPEFLVSHTYANNPAGQPAGSFTATAALTDGHDPASIETASIRVSNVAPVLTSAATGSSSTNKTQIGQSLPLTGTFTDPGVLDTHIVSVAWGDGSKATSYPLAAGVLGFNLSHVYAKAGTYAVTVQVTDSDGAASSTKIVFAYVEPALSSAAGAAVLAPVVVSAAAPPPLAPKSVLSTVGTSATPPAPIVLSPVYPSSGGNPNGPILEALAAAFDVTDTPITLLKSSQVRLAVSVPQPVMAKPKPAPLLFDPVTGNLVDSSLRPGADGVFDFGEDWLLLPPQSGQPAPV